jgi:hypothetical protein
VAATACCVPGEGPVNTGNQGVHEHQWATRVRSEYLDELEVERKGVVDDEAACGRPRRGAARG